MGVMEKIAATAAEKVEAHHASDVKDWRAFEKNLKSKAFNKAVQLHPASDDKLKAYTDQNHKYLKSSQVAGKVPSDSIQRKKYQIKVLPGGGLGCGCKDWQYKRSHQGGDCKHIRAYKAELHQAATIAPGKIKASSVIKGIRGGVALARAYERSEQSRKKARLMETSLSRLRAGEPIHSVASTPRE